MYAIRFHMSVFSILTSHGKVSDADECTSQARLGSEHREMMIRVEPVEVMTSILIAYATSTASERNHHVLNRPAGESRGPPKTG
jgi:hypothetical protein